MRSPPTGCCRASSGWACIRAGTADVRASLRADDRDARRRQRGADWRLAGERVDAFDLRLGEEFYPHRFSANAAAEAPVAFAGFGIVSPERGHDDYRDAARGRIVLVLDREPGVNDPASPFDGVVTAEAALPIKKVLAAQEKGAVGVIFVEDVHNQTAPSVELSTARPRTTGRRRAPRIERYTLKSWSDKVRIPVVQVSAAVAERLVASSGRSLLALARTAETRGGVQPVAVSGRSRCTTRVAHRTVNDRSIVALIDGSDPQLKNEYVLVSAHFDHDGADGPRIFNGADDDGSGTVGLIEIAEAYALAAQAGSGRSDR